ncbi:MAG TPA: hypothetical protein VJY63_10305 [Marinospirillum sp.]|uniref:hypothetical protein n=1 Tax=Marinospirillum sp. TaxID=2183934 RepID=UPI002B477026|nr:hypothetical protein [Marinospirillum sp.]HKM16290.1 hypothetical protein [Marinospirillum sp.]
MAVCLYCTIIGRGLFTKDLAQRLNVCGDYCGCLGDDLSHQAEVVWLSGDQLGKQLTKVIQ